MLQDPSTIYFGSQSRVNKQDKVSPMQVEILLLFDYSPFHPDPGHYEVKRTCITVNSEDESSSHSYEKQKLKLIFPKAGLDSL